MDPVGRMDISIVIISYNTRDLLRECLQVAEREAAPLHYEILVVDNASRDGSADMVEREFPRVRLFKSEENLGFAAANNIAFRAALGKYVVLLNSDAFPKPGALLTCWRHMEADNQIGIGGGRLLGRDNAWQPSARMFPTVLRDLLILSGLADRFPKSRFFGQPDRTWSDLDKAAEVDWVPGAFFFVRRDLLQSLKYFDEGFYFYYEEVDLCRRCRNAGYSVWYFPDVVILHLGGESASALTHLEFSKTGRQLTLWRMRSALLYYRKHHGASAWLAGSTEVLWHWLRACRNKLSMGTVRKEKVRQSTTTVSLMFQAWRDTAGGRLSPPRPW